MLQLYIHFMFKPFTLLTLPGPLKCREDTFYLWYCTLYIFFLLYSVNFKHDYTLWWSFSLYNCAISCPVDHLLSCNLSLDGLMMPLLVASDTIPSPAKMSCFYDFSICGFLKHFSTWMSCHRCYKNVRRRWYGLLPRDLACSCKILLFHKHCKWPKVLFQDQLRFHFWWSWIWSVHLNREARHWSCY